MLQHHDLLMTIAQVSATFAGFSGVIGIFGRGSSLSKLEIGALQVRAVVELGYWRQALRCCRSFRMDSEYRKP
jgi:hypothetical protein